MHTSIYQSTSSLPEKMGLEELCIPRLVQNEPLAYLEEDSPERLHIGGITIIRQNQKSNHWSNASRLCCGDIVEIPVTNASSPSHASFPSLSPFGRLHRREDRSRVFLDGLRHKRKTLFHFPLLFSWNAQDRRPALKQ